MRNLNRLARQGAYLVLIVGVLYSCASIGSPDGGPIDVTPPVFEGSTPEMGATNVDKKKITLHFDEFIKLEGANEKVVVSPPQIQQPLIKPNGKKVVISLEDSLKANTTYTIDFGDAIVDNNEGNPLGDFTFTFSTSAQIDTLAVSGIVLHAEDLEPIKNIMVGLHANLSDTAFTTEPFIRVARTDSKGEFTIHGIAPGKYKVYALEDQDQNFYFSQKSERIAFSDSIYIPTFEERIRQDTIWKDSLTVDTIHTRKYTHYLPDDIILRAFKEEFYKQYLVKHERSIENKLSIYFAEYPDTVPTIKGINFDESILIADYMQPIDTIFHYWIPDSLVYQKDTLFMEVGYLHTDTLDQLVAKTDTLRFTYKHKKERKEKDKKRADEELKEETTKFLAYKADISANFNIYDYIRINFEEPLLEVDSNKVHLLQKQDTLWLKLDDYVFEKDEVDTKQYNLFYPWAPGESYKLSVDSLAFVGLYGLHTDKIEQEFKIRPLEDYGSVIFNISGLSQDEEAFVELLDTSDKVIRTVDVVNSIAEFYYLEPGKYSARLIVDSNKNGKWDTGSYEQKIQPEMVYYYPQLVEFKANWSASQDWDLNAKPLSKQKLDELKKQKPDEKKKPRTERRRR